MKMNSQTRIIVFTAVALAAFDLSVRGLFAPRPVYVDRAGADVVTAREFRLVDNDGNLRAHLFTDENSEPGLVLYDREGKQRAQLDTFDKVPSLILFNEREQRSSYFGMDEAGLGIFSLYGLNGPDSGTLYSMDASVLGGETVRNANDGVSAEASCPN